MQRTRGDKKVTAILTSDWHLREDTPTCYIGDYQKEQWNSVDFISDLQKRYNCPVLHGGDLFDHWKPSPWLIRMAILHLPNQFFTIYGQHDLPAHNLDLVDKCGVNALEAAGKLAIFGGVHWGQTPENAETDIAWQGYGKKVLVWHHMTYKGAPPFPRATGGQASMILRNYPQYDLILTGDNHQAFTVTYGNQILVNPGSLMRMDADQIDFKPSVFLWFAEDNSVQQVFLPIEEGVISREHIEIKEQRDARIDAFVSRLDNKWQAGMSFEQNLEEFAKTNNIRSSVMEIVYKSIE